ncbi:hypothetical protein GO003_010185 [Methylicorpusculum oleiharenae]|uniref:hypothetical protein n=1 Tax=Methylicorpusculum oleiharenae TaxID=1338687 RepID=UPI001358A007|nr:hypothetical protein [Methylicorpusculum oleiharenae]MCD2450761.1 hypothetical protein [Methylicorpusculum oleiharenae]
MNNANQLHFSHGLFTGSNEYNQHGSCNRLGLQLNASIIGVAKYLVCGFENIPFQHIPSNGEITALGGYVQILGNRSLLSSTSGIHPVECK